MTIKHLQDCQSRITFSEGPDRARAADRDSKECLKITYTAIDIVMCEDHFI